MKLILPFCNEINTVIPLLLIILLYIHSVKYYSFRSLNSIAFMCSYCQQNFRCIQWHRNFYYGRILKLMSTENKFYLWKGLTSSDFVFSSVICSIKIGATVVI